MPVAELNEVQNILQTQLRLCPDCKSRDSFSYYPLLVWVSDIMPSSI